MKAQPLEIEIDNLILDVNNPRFAELYSGSTNEDDLITYLLYDEAAEEVAKAITKAGEFYPDRPLWVINQDGKYLVKDGNRRCSAVKALQLPGKYKLGLKKFDIKKLPVLLYENQSDIDERIVEEHAGSLFRKWERIAKALEVIKLADANKLDEMHELDSKPGDLIKLASFYREAVKHGGDKLKAQLRRGRGETGGKTIIYERLFRDAKLCGYRFKNSPSHRIDIFDNEKFKSYIKALVLYIEKHPKTKTKDLDNNKNFIGNLKDFGFDPYAKQLPVSSPSPQSTNNSQTSPAPGQGQSSTNSSNSSQPSAVIPSAATTPSSVPASPTTPAKRGTVKKYPDIKRKQLPPGLKARIDEYFSIDNSTMANSKIAMSRVIYECVLKFVVENTKSGNVKFSNSGHFGTAYARKPFTNFEEMNKKFIELIVNTGIKQAFNNFEFDKMHQIIHNYHVSGTAIIAEQIKNNLLVLLEFMLQDSDDLLNSLDLTKIK